MGNALLVMCAIAVEDVRGSMLFIRLKLLANCKIITLRKSAQYLLGSTNSTTEICFWFVRFVGEPGLTAVVCNDGGIDLQEHAIHTNPW